MQETIRSSLWDPSKTYGETLQLIRSGMEYRRRRYLAPGASRCACTHTYRPVFQRLR